MELFKDLKVEGVEQTEDSLGGFKLLETDVYPATIKVAYAGASESGALNVTLVYAIDGTEYSETLYVTNKQKEPFYINKEDNKKHFLPGYNIVNSVCALGASKTLVDMETEPKNLSIYSYKEKKKVISEVQVLSDLTGANLLLGITKELVNKQEKVGDKYEPTAETREENHIQAVFDSETKQTFREKLDKKEPEFMEAWLNQNKGKTLDRRKIKEGSSGYTGSPLGSSEKKVKSLFS